MTHNKADDDRQIHALAFLRRSNPNEKKFFHTMCQWETVAENNPIIIKAFAGTQGKHNRKGYWHRTLVC